MRRTEKLCIKRSPAIARVSVGRGAVRDNSIEGVGGEEMGLRGLEAESGGWRAGLPGE